METETQLAGRVDKRLWETAAYSRERQQVEMIGLGLTDTTQNLLKLELKYEGADPANSIGDRNNGSMREQKITVPTVGSNPGFTAIQSYTYDSLNRIDDVIETIGAYRRGARILIMTAMAIAVLLRRIRRPLEIVPQRSAIRLFLRIIPTSTGFHPGKATATTRRAVLPKMLRVSILSTMLRITKKSFSRNSTMVERQMQLITMTAKESV